MKTRSATIMVALVAVAGALPAQARGSSYTAEFEVTRERTLADGRRAVENLKEVRARDAQGRSLVSAATVPDAGDSPVTQVLVVDSVARTSTAWSVPGDRAVVTPILDFEEMSRICASRKGIKVRPSDPKAIPKPPKAPSKPGSAVSEPMSVDLGKATIAGVEARGSREFKRTPVKGSSGSKQVIRMREIWLATDPTSGPFVVKVVIDDPGIERFTQELVRLERYEPYPTIFQPPQGYEIVTRSADQVSCPAQREPELLKPPPW